MTTTRGATTTSSATTTTETEVTIKTNYPSVTLTRFLWQEGGANHKEILKNAKQVIVVIE